MGFFSELKSDLSQAVNTLMPEDKLEETANLDNESEVSGKKGEKVEKVDISSMLDRIDDITLDDVNPETEKEEVVEEEPEVEEPAEKVVSAVEMLSASKAVEPVDDVAELEKEIEEQTAEELKVEEEVESTLNTIATSKVEEYVTETKVSENNTNNGGDLVMDFEQQTPTDETASITEGMVITGDVNTTGSLDLIGKVTGNIKSLGKLNVTGEIVGDSEAAEIYAESARITGEVKSKGSVKVGQSTVIVGNIFGSSAVIAGAVKGDIDVHGPVVLDTTAIVMGNIKSQSVQINNGAVIEGMCSQAYADVNPSEFFEGLKNR